VKCSGLLIGSALCLATVAAAAQQSESVALSNAVTLEIANQAEALAAGEYWTAERMANAKPRDATIAVSPQSIGAAVSIDENAPLAVPGFSRGCRPNALDCDTSAKTLSSAAAESLMARAAGDLLLPMHGAKPVNPATGPYGPFQRWREAESIAGYPKSTVGKLFFTLDGRNWVCSASVIARSTLITAGHCNSNGRGTFATNRLFCPSWNGGPRPGRGCWTVVTSAVSTAWHTTGDPDTDYSCLVTSAVGQVVANRIGNVTGWLGRAWNFPPSQAERTFGYPQDPPFNGATLQTTASTEWYTHDFRAGGQVSKVIGSDLTGGSSGGPWVLGWTGGLPETPDTDGSLATDPGSNWVNGVNSHKRCIGNCNSPPTATSGVFWQEMTSPPFMNTAAGGETEDVIAACFSAGGT
jgi:V8-like Glu-specific endopeptidase